jgi:hypothetical protein
MCDVTAKSSDCRLPSTTASLAVGISLSATLGEGNESNIKAGVREPWEIVGEFEVSIALLLPSRAETAHPSLPSRHNQGPRGPSTNGRDRLTPPPQTVRSVGITPGGTVGTEGRTTIREGVVDQEFWEF